MPIKQLKEGKVDDAGIKKIPRIFTKQAAFITFIAFTQIKNKTVQRKLMNTK